MINVRKDGLVPLCAKAAKRRITTNKGFRSMTVRMCAQCRLSLQKALGFVSSPIELSLFGVSTG